MSMKKMLGGILVTATMLLMATVAQAAVTTLGSSGTATWGQPVANPPGTTGVLVEFAPGDSVMSFTLASGTGVSIVADDCCISGDMFGLILDGISKAWSFSDTIGSSYGSGLFHGVYMGFLGAGTHTFSFDVTADCCGYGMMGWSTAVSAVPEPESYAMLLTGLGLLGYMVRRRKDLGA